MSQINLKGYQFNNIVEVALYVDLLVDSPYDDLYLCYSDQSKLENVEENSTEKVKWLIWFLTQRYNNMF